MVFGVYNLKNLKKYLVVVAPALLFAIIVALFIYSSRSITVSAVPFGLPAGTNIPVGLRAKFSSHTAAEADLRRANDLRTAGALKAAQDNYETILLKYPNLPAALFGAAYSMLAEDFVSKENIAKAKILIENLARQMPGSVWVQLLLTFSKEHEGNLSHALEMATALAAASPAFSEARLRYADLLLKAGYLERAAEEARTAISISAGSEARAYVILAFALHKMGNLEECSELVNYALPRFPSQTDLLLLHGYLSEYSRDFEKAQDNYRKILALKPGDINALNAMATLGEKVPPSSGTIAAAGGGISLQDQAREAAKIIMPLIEEYPENLPLREALGKIYLKARLIKEARAQFSEIHAQDFDYPNIRKLMNEASEEQIKFMSPATSAPLLNSKALADSLARTFAMLSTLNEAEITDSDELGRYFVYYGATFKDFFDKYSVTRYKKIDENTFSETYRIGSFIYENTIFFDAKKKFYATRTTVSDTLDADSLGYIQDFFRHFLKKESKLLGEGSPEAAHCSGEKWEGVIWASRDNLEVLVYNPKAPRRVFIIRLHASRFPDTGNLCHYVNIAKGKSRMPR
jgi:tetratricopeptide (TPR) repeat protein